jgi:hypothetical protein
MDDRRYFTSPVFPLQLPHAQEVVRFLTDLSSYRVSKLKLAVLWDEVLPWPC